MSARLDPTANWRIARILGSNGNAGEEPTVLAEEIVEESIPQSIFYRGDPYFARVWIEYKPLKSKFPGATILL